MSFAASDARDHVVCVNEREKLAFRQPQPLLRALRPCPAASETRQRRISAAFAATASTTLLVSSLQPLSTTITSNEPACDVRKCAMYSSSVGLYALPARCRQESLWKAPRSPGRDLVELTVAMQQPLNALIAPRTQP